MLRLSNESYLRKMKITPAKTKNIQELFKNMNSKIDFLALLNEAKKIEYGEKSIPFEEKQLNYYISKYLNDFKNVKSKKKNPFILNENQIDLNTLATPSYITFNIKKKSGENRNIHSPTKGLKELQKALNVILQCVHQPHINANGFVLGKSIVDNSKVHVGQIYVYNLDLKDFFSSVDKSRIWGRLLFAPFNLNSTPERKKIANIIAGLSCTLKEVERLVDNEWIKTISSVLPQGAPTSPTLTNAICEKLDKQLTGVSKRFGINYTRYADDITFSGKHNNYEIKPNTFEKIFVANSTFDKEVRRIIESQSFNVKESKVRFQKEGFRQEVTGLIVNDKVNVPRRYIKQLRQWIYYWETYGYDKAYNLFLQSYLFEKGYSLKGQPNMIMVLNGKLLYLKMVKGENDTTYTKLRERFKKLADSKDSMSDILNIWEDEGIERAMDFFYSQKPNYLMNSTRINKELDEIASFK
jgi:RNA-directed DNA polymerase